MTKLNQIIAVTNGEKANTQKAVSEAFHKVQKEQLIHGISRQYTPKDEDGERLPSESKRVNYNVTQALSELQEALVPLFNIVATQDYANCQAKANILINNEVVLKQVPVTHLLFIEKQLLDIAKFIEKLPLLDQAEEWHFDSNTGCWVSKTQETIKTKKIPKAFVKYEATKEHPAQVEVFHEDVIAGTWATTKYSGAIPQTQQKELLTRVNELQKAVKKAREEGNNIEIEHKETGKAIFDYLLKGAS
jgi:hypothetical protein